jgi:GrpB-like predicted nucleotidyltransferase (UPF0157 family)
VVLDYDPAWPAAFEQLRRLLAPTLVAGAVIEHVGSTSVPGLAAKPIIDLDIVVATTNDVSPMIARLNDLGYDHLGDYGIPGREAFSVPEGLPYHHLYVVVAGSKPYLDHVDLRDHLLTNPAAVERYAAEKRRLAHLLVTDRHAYLAGKTWLIEEMLANARNR